jgi:hypothetical protein
MIGSLRWNFAVSIVAFALTFTFSLLDNVLLTTLIRSIYSFIILFALMFVFRWVFGIILNYTEQQHMEQEDDSSKGVHIDLTTPLEEETVSDLPVSGEDKEKSSKAPTSDKEEFSPLTPPKLSKLNQSDAAQLADALRHLSEK